MSAFLVNCAVRSALLAGIASIVLLALRIQAAAVLHRAWTVVLLAMLLLPLCSAVGPRFSVPLPQSGQGPGLVSLLPEAVVKQVPISDVAVVTPAQGRALSPHIDAQAILDRLYVVGVIVLLTRLVLGTGLAWQLRRRAVIVNGRMTSPSCGAPVTIGLLKPAVLLPEDWRTWPEGKLSAVLTHEAEHAHRRDPLVQWLAHLNSAIFWFHPLAWWLERRLAALAEEACDAAVLAAGHSRENYSAYLLDFARSALAHGGTVRVGTAMPGPSLNGRIRRILSEISDPPVSRTRALSVISIVAGASVVLLAGTPTARQAAPTTLAQARPVRAGEIPKFDVVSIKPCDTNAVPPGARGGGGGGSSSPGKLNLECQTTAGLIQAAYLVYANGRFNPPWTVVGTPISGGPDWMRSERYAIEAEAAGSPAQEMMSGPMLQAVLEDRFRLELRRETLQVPVYELTVAKSGSKLKPFQPGTCAPLDWSRFPPPPPASGERRCAAKSTSSDSGTIAWDVEAMSLDEFASHVLRLDRPVLNKTGISGLVGFHLTYEREQGGQSSGLGQPGDPGMIASAIRAQLGLDLHPATGPHDTLIIDHIERPLPNNPGPTRARSASPGRR